MNSFRRIMEDPWYIPLRAIRFLLVASMTLAWLSAMEPQVLEKYQANLASHRELWPKKVIVLETLTWHTPNGDHTIKGGTPISLIEVSVKGILVGDEEGKYGLSIRDTNLPYLFDESDFTDPPAVQTTGTTTSDSAITTLLQEGPNFDFILKENVELTDELQDKTVQLLLTQGGWRKLSLELSKSLWSAYEKGSTESSDWKDRLALAHATGLLGISDEKLNHGKPSFRANRMEPLFKQFQSETLMALLKNRPLLQHLDSGMVEEDNPVGVWSVLAELQESIPEVPQEYPALAVALAVVYDRPIPPRWPHPQVDHQLVPLIPDKPWLILARYFMEADQNGALQTKIKELPVADLKYVVDAPIDPGEFLWARKNVKQRRSSFDQAYFEVQYDERRISGTQAQYDWPHPNLPYTLENIKKMNGICIDQSYFSSIAAKAYGIPSIQISGKGATGGHAWLGFMPTNEKWNMKGGRYETQNFVVGEAYDPQTWQSINDYELNYISQRFSDSAEFKKSQELLSLLDLSSPWITGEQRQKLLIESKTTCPQNPLPWFKLEKFYEHEKRSDDLKILYQEMIEQFAFQKDWKTHAQTRLAAIASKNGEFESADELKNKIQMENKSKRSDLAIASAADDILRKLYHDKADEALADYQSLLRRFGKSTGLTLMNQVVYPFVRSAMGLEKWEIAEAGLKSSKSLVEEGGYNSINQTKIAYELLQKELKATKSAGTVPP